MSLVTIVPLDTPFTQNLLDLTNYNHSERYKNGQYLASSSSNSNNHLAYNAFNKDSLAYWECGNTNTDSNPPYRNDPYINASPSSYIGVKPEYIIKTLVGNTNVEGEWIQIELPYKVYLTNYSILPKQDINNQQFPQKFYLLGSNDGVDWNIVDQQINGRSRGTNIPTIFSVTTIYNYRFFRLVICELNKGTTVSICQLKLDGNLNLISGNAYLTNSIVFSSQENVVYNGGENSNMISIDGNIYTNGATIVNVNPPNYEGIIDPFSPSSTNIIEMKNNKYELYRNTDPNSIMSSLYNFLFTKEGLEDRIVITPYIGNCDFKTPVLDTNTYKRMNSDNNLENNDWTSVPTWTGTAALLNSVDAWNYPKPYPYGSQCVSIDGNKFISQSVHLSPNTYELSVYACGRQINNTNNSNSINISFNNAIIGTITPQANVWAIYTFNIIVHNTDIFPLIFVGTSNINADNATALQHIQLKVKEDTNLTPLNNSCFDLPNIANNSHVIYNSKTIVPSWEFNAILINQSTAWGYSMPYPKGTQCVSIRAQSYISQSVQLQAGVSEIVLYACGRGCCVPGTNPVDIFVDDNKVGTIYTQVNNWLLYSFPVNVTSTRNYIIKFVGTSTNDRASALQNIQIRTKKVEGFTSKNNTSSINIDPFPMTDLNYSLFTLNEGFVNGQVASASEMASVPIDQYNNALMNYQLIPLTRAIQVNSDSTNQINNTREKIKSLAQSYLSNDSGTGNDNVHLLSDQIYNGKPSLSDGRQEDINEMIVNENNLYILGTITLATLLVGIIVIARN